MALAGSGSSWSSVFWATGLRGHLVGDVNDDGFAELACLVRLDVDAGAYIYFGGAPMDSIHDLGLQGPGYPDLMLGSDISDGDVNGDSYTDIAVGAYATENHPEWQNAAWVYFGGPNVDETVDLQLAPSQVASDYEVCTAGDLDGDSYDDVIVSWAHWAYVYFGGPLMDAVVDLSFTGKLPWGIFSLAGGDLNNDGFADVIVSEVSYYPDVDEGRLAVYFGGAEMDTIPDIEVYGPEGYGETVTWIGDMTGDGWAEFAVSNPEGRGEIYIYTMGEVSGNGPNPSALNAGELRIMPNPSRGMAMIRFDLDSADFPEVKIYDLAGHLVRRLNATQQQAGCHWFPWDGRSASGRLLPDGTYVVRVHHHNEAIAKRIVLSR
jgi:hypothetical protein